MLPAASPASGITRILITTVRPGGWEGEPVKHKPEDLPDRSITFKAFGWKARMGRPFSMPALSLRSASRQKKI